MPEGYTECYEFGYGYDLVDQLRELGYECVNVEDEVEVQTQTQTPMFQW